MGRNGSGECGVVDGRNCRNRRNWGTGGTGGWWDRRNWTGGTGGWWNRRNRGNRGIGERAKR